ncbi:MAG: adenylosuccinate synthase [Candidatus Aenigmatarchaeota archaeon]
MIYAVIGLQWGDEGKGKVVDLLADNKKINYVVRFNGGSNAGHTVKLGNEVYRFHLLPSGILHEDVINIIGSGVVVDPGVLIHELDSLKNIKPNLRISERANLIMPYHKLIDAQEGGKIGTTGKGIGPAYMSKVGRYGIRFCDIITEDNNVDEDGFRLKLNAILERENQILEKIYGIGSLSLDEVFEEYIGYAERLKGYVADTYELLYKAKKRGDSILLEGAQGVMLDIDFGTYPYVTSSNTNTNGIHSGTGVRLNPDKVIGVMKAYTTRVGKGPLPTELEDKCSEEIRRKGNEYGTTTGRPRRCGPLDLVALRFAIQVSEPDELCITKLDVLDGFETIRYCDAYDINGKKYEKIPSRTHLLDKCKPIYKEIPGWQCDTTGIKRWNNLPINAKRYIEKLEECLEVPITMISVGPSREQIIYK